MANFFRDSDHDAFNAENDPTASTYIPGSRPQTTDRRSASRSPRKNVANGSASQAPESLIKRMGGASATKAGLVIDRSEIDRKIYEVSKGSSFFENERQKDAILTTKLTAFKEEADRKMIDLIPGSPRWIRVEKEIDSIVQDLEAHRDLSRTIVHCDMDMFYAAVELRRDPSLKGKAFCVGGQDGVLVTASYEARRFGVSSGMAGFVAKALCPHLIFIKNAMSDYVDASRIIMDVLATFDHNMAQASLDEAYLDITEYCAEHEMSPEEVVKQIREDVRSKTDGLSVSCGIAPNTMLAKICSDKNKPDGQYRIPPTREACLEFMRDLRCRKCPGIGKVAERQLSELGISVWSDVWASRVRLHTVLRNGVRGLLRQYLGLGSTVVEPGKRENRKSVGRESTFTPTKDLKAMQARLMQCAEQLQKDLERLEFRGRTLTLVVKTAKFQRLSRAKTSQGMGLKYLAEDLYKVTSDLLFELQSKWNAARYGAFEMRLIGLRLTNLRDLRAGEARGSLAWTVAQNEKQSSTSSSKSFDHLFVDDGDDDINGGAEDKGEPKEKLTEQEQFELAVQRSLQDQKNGEHGYGYEGEAEEVLEEEDVEEQRSGRGTTPESPKARFEFLAPEAAASASKSLVDKASPGPGTDATSGDSVPRHSSALIAADSTSHDQGASASRCPICNNTLPRRKSDEGEATHNARVNAHLDACLSGPAELQEKYASRGRSDQQQQETGRRKSSARPRSVTSASPSPPAGKKLKQSTLDAWRR